MTKAESVVTIQNITQSHLAQVMTSLLVVSPLRQAVAFVVTGNVGVEVGRVIGQQPAGHQLFFLPQTEQSQLGLFQFIALARRQRLASINSIKAIPESLGAESFRRKSPQRRQDAVPIPVGHFGLRPRLADALDGGQEQIMRRRRTGTGLGPERLEQRKDS